MIRRRHLRSWVKWCLGAIGIIGCSLFGFAWINQSKVNCDSSTLPSQVTTVKDAPLLMLESQPYSLDEYQRINPYIVAIVEFENRDGTHRIPVIETFSSSDAEYWSDHAYDGSPNTLGSAFIDEHTPIDGGNHQLINGHSSYSDSRMFTFMLHYQQADYFNDNPSFKWIDDLGVSTYTIYAFAHYPMETSIQTTGMFLQNTIYSRTLIDYLTIDQPYILHQREVDLSASRYLSFVTCDQVDKTNRYILLAYCDSRK